MRRRLVAAGRNLFRSLRTRNVRLFMSGQLVSQSGTWMQRVAAIWVAFQLTDDGFVLGLVTAAQFLPVLLLGAWAGVFVDRIDRHRLLIFTQSAFAVVATAFTFLTFSGNLTIVAIYGLSGIYGVITALDNPARKIFVAELVDEEDIANAVGLNSALMTGSRVYGPTIAGVLLATVGAGWCFAVNALSYLAVIGALLAIDRSDLRSPDPVPRGTGQLREGLKHAWSTPELRLPLVLVAVVGTFIFEFDVTLPPLAERTFDGDAGTFTLIYASMSVGSVMGALSVARRATIDTRFLANSAAWMALSLVALSASPTLWLALIAAVPVGATTLSVISGSTALVQIRAAPHIRGRVVALTSVVFIGSRPIGGPLAGWISEAFGARAPLLLGAVSAAAVAVWTRRQARRIHSPGQSDDASIPRGAIGEDRAAPDPLVGDWSP